MVNWVSGVTGRGQPHRKGDHVRISTSGRRTALLGRLTLVAALPLLACTGCGKGDQAPSQPTPERNLEGSLDEVNAESVAGWVWDKHLP